MEYNPEYQTGIVAFNAIVEIVEKTETTQLNNVEGVDTQSRRIFVAALTHVLARKHNEIGVVGQYGYETTSYAYELSRMLERLKVLYECKGDIIEFDGKSVRFFKASDPLRSLSPDVLVLVAPSDRVEKEALGIINKGAKIISIK